MVSLKACSISADKTFSTHFKIGSKKVQFTFKAGHALSYLDDYRTYLIDHYKDYNKIPVPLYKEKSVPCVAFYFLSELLETLLRAHPYIIHDKLHVTISTFRDPSQEEIMHYYPHRSTHSHAQLGITWYYLIETIIHPYFHDMKIQHDKLGRTLLHEFIGHFGDKLTGLDREEAKSARKLKMGNPKLKMLNQALYDLRAEGLAQFIEYKGLEIPLNFRAQHSFATKLQNLLRKRTQSSMGKYYEDHLYTEEGIYEAGLMMCATIALAKAKTMGQHVRTRPWRFTYHQWASTCSRGSIGPVPHDVFEATRKEIAACVYPVLFLRSYHEACETLGIEEVLSPELFYKLTERASKTSEHMAQVCKDCPDFIGEYKGSTSF